MRRLLIALAVLSVAVLAVKPASADSFYVGYSSGYRHGPPPRFYGPPRYYGPRYYGPRYYGPRYGPRFYGPHYRYGYRHGYYHRGHDYGRYAAGGLVLGLALGHVLNTPSPRVVETRTVERIPETTPVPEAAVTQTESLPALGYRLARDGTCWLLEDGGDGRTIATEQPPTACAR
ncbi:MAG: hypothetical protein AAGE01_24005 [Pseudomonadota bacterium]